MQRLAAARVSQHRKSKGMRKNFHFGTLALQGAISADVIFVGVGINYRAEGFAFQLCQQLRGGMGAAAVHQQAIHPVAGCPVVRQAGYRVCQVVAGDRAEFSSLNSKYPPH